MTTSEKEILEELKIINSSKRTGSPRKYWEEVKNIQIREKREFEDLEKRTRMKKETLDRCFSL